MKKTLGFLILLFLVSGFLFAEVQTNFINKDLQITINESDMLKNSVIVISVPKAKFSFLKKGNVVIKEGKIRSIKTKGDTILLEANKSKTIILLKNFTKYKNKILSIKINDKIYNIKL